MSDDAGGGDRGTRTGTGNGTGTGTAPDRQRDPIDPEWPVRAEETTYDCDGFEAGHDEVERPDGTRAAYHWVAPPADGVAVVARHGDSLVLVERYRPAVRQTFLSCPAGGRDPDEEWTEAAARELRAETGFRANRVRHLGTYHPHPTLRFRRGVVYADDLEPGAPDRDAGAFLDVHAVPVGEALSLARAPPANGWTLPPLLMAQSDGLL